MDFSLPLIIANWKANKDEKKALEWLEKIDGGAQDFSGSIVFCPSSLYISAASKIIKEKNSKIFLGAQDVSVFDNGAYTGETTAKMLSGFVKFVIIGHSERRKYFSESPEMVEKKVKQAKKNSLEPIVCVKRVNDPFPQDAIIFAYEPVFAIGTGNPDTPENAAQVAGQIKEKKDDAVVLYGGSVIGQNIHSFLEKDSIDGALVGSASLEADSFLDILRNT